MSIPTKFWRVPASLLLVVCASIPAVSSAHAARSGVIRACIEKSTQQIVMLSSCSPLQQTPITWRKAAKSDSVIKVCVTRASFVTKWTATGKCGKDMLVKWTVTGSSTTSMTGCVDKQSKVLVYSPMNWCPHTSHKLSWLRTVAPTATSASTTTSVTPTTVASTTTTVAHSTTTTTAPTGNYMGVQYGSDSDDGITGMVSDASGNVYSTGYMCGAASGMELIGGGSGSCGAFVAKHSSTDQLLWMKRLDFNDASGTGHIALSPNGSIYVTAYTTIGSDRDIQVSKFDASGSNTWNAAFGTGRIDQPQAIAIDAAENIFIAGETQGDFGDTSVDNPSSQSNIFVGKYHWSSGALHNDWVTGYGSNKKESVTSLILLSGGSLAISGDTRGIMPGSGASAPGTNTDAAFVSKLDSSGTVSWTKQWTGSAPITTSGLATDSSGDLYLAGATFSDLRQLSVDKLDPDGYVIKLNIATGVTIWTRMFGSSGNELSAGIATDTDGSLIIGGYTNGTMAGKTLSSRYHPYAVKIDTSGNFQWTVETAAVGSLNTYVWTVTSAPGGGIILCGESALNFGGQNVDNSNSTADNLYLRISSSGAFPAKHN